MYRTNSWFPRPLPVFFCVALSAGAAPMAEVIDFRSESWVRTGAGLRGDGLQYAPAFGRGSDWQLYNGPGYTSAVELPAGEWIRVRIEVMGKRARIYFGGEQPALVVQDLKHEPVAATSQRCSSTGSRLPESVLYDPRREVLYVTQYFRGGNEYISRIALDGQILDQEWIRGLDRPTGLLADGEHLLFGQSEDGRLQRVTLADKKVETLAVLGQGANVDGLRFDGRGNYVISDFNGRVFLVTPAGEVTPVLDTTASGARSADLEFVPGKSLLIVPGLFDNRLTAYRLNLSQ